MLKNPKYLLISLSTSNVAYCLEQNILYLHLVFPSISVQRGKRTKGDIIQRLPCFSTTGMIVLWTKVGANMTAFDLSEGKGVKWEKSKDNSQESELHFTLVDWYKKDTLFTKLSSWAFISVGFTCAMLYHYTVVKWALSNSSIFQISRI